MGVEDVGRVVGDDVTPRSPELTDEAEVATQQRKPQVQPFLDRFPFFGPDDRRRAKTQLHAGVTETVAKGTHAGEWRRWMSQERVEADFGRAGDCRDLGILEAIDLCT